MTRISSPATTAAADKMMMGWRFNRIFSSTSSIILIVILLQCCALSLASSLASLQTGNQLSNPTSQLHDSDIAPPVAQTLAASNNGGNIPVVLYDGVSLDGALGKMANAVPPTLSRAKRERPSWQSLRGSWGKRQNIPDGRGWTNFRNSWGKKADWSSLRGSWGKRGGDQSTTSLLQQLSDDDLLKRTAGWSSLHGSWGKRGDSDEDLLKRAGWSSLQGSWGKRSDADDADDEEVYPVGLSSGNQRPASAEDEMNESFDKNYEPYGAMGARNQISDVQSRDLDENPTEESMLKDKRAKTYSSGWLKRPDARLLLAPRSVNWSSLRGSWGKRGNAGGNWSQLRGTWGKRGGEDNWSQLRGSWGKRPAATNGDSWNKFRGSWGKRDTDGSAAQAIE